MTTLVRAAATVRRASPLLRVLYASTLSPNTARNEPVSQYSSRTIRKENPAPATSAAHVSDPKTRSRGKRSLLIGAYASLAALIPLVLYGTWHVSSISTARDAYSALSDAEEEFSRLASRDSIDAQIQHVRRCLCACFGEQAAVGAFDAPANMLRHLLNEPAARSPELDAAAALVTTLCAEISSQLRAAAAGSAVERRTAMRELERGLQERVIELKTRCAAAIQSWEENLYEQGR
ncbi:hypothetical protein HDZ31DRAFT_79129 [Schizophyllum fasciatum]